MDNTDYKILDDGGREVKIVDVAGEVVARFPRKHAAKAIAVTNPTFAHSRLSRVPGVGNAVFTP
jgi:hypothetical protein